MSVCDSCSYPGSCCSSFELNLWFNKESWYEDAVQKLKEYNIEFFKSVFLLPHDADSGKVKALFSCTRLGINGKCTEYDNRPELCKLYEPKSDWLCCEHERNFKGIKIVKEK